MSDTVFHAHIGVHEVFPSLLSVAATELSQQLRRDSAYFVTPEQFRTEVRPSLGKHGKASDLVGAERFTRIILSSHALLCRHEKVYSATSGLYISIVPALERLASFFEGEQLILHVTLPPQRDYALISDAVSKPGTNVSWNVSWTGLVEQVVRHFPQAKIILWPIERREQDGLRFVQGILGIALDPFMKLKVMRMASEQRAWGPKIHIDPFSATSAYLDDAFHSDLDALCRLNNVSFAIKVP